MRPSGLSEAVEMYLKSLAVLGGAERPVAVALLAERLAVTPAAANEMLRRLVREELAVHDPYHGFRLTETGREAAWDVIRRERLWERFLVDHLALNSTQATGWACLLEHATTPEVIDALDAFLGYPVTCPQGQPIPRLPGDRVHLEGQSLADADVGDVVRLVAFDDEDPEVLGYLREHGLAIGIAVRVTEVGPRRSVIGVEHERGSAMIGAELASSIHTVPAEQAEPAEPAGTSPLAVESPRPTVTVR